MRIYIAAHSQHMARDLKKQLELLGHAVVARWIEHDAKFGSGAASYSDEERKSLAAMDEDDVRNADALVLLAEPEGRFVPGGKHVETGIALGIGIPVYVVGRRENIFHWHPRVEVVESVDCLFQLLDPSVQRMGSCNAVSISDRIDGSKGGAGAQYVRGREGYDSEGYDRSGYNRDGYDRDGFDRNGYDYNGFSRDGFNRDGYDRDGNRLPLLTIPSTEGGDA